MLRQFIGDLKPRGLVGHKNMRCWPDGWGVNECSQSDMYPRAAIHDRIQKRSAEFTMNVVIALRIAENQYVLLAPGEVQLAAFDTGETFEG